MGELSAPRITVFIPAYNAERYIKQAIESVLAQTCQDFELLLIDDASTDATAALMAGYLGDRRVRLVRHETNRQRPRTRSEGIALARGEYVALLDADDLCAPERLARQCDFLDRRPAVDVVGTWWKRIDGEGNALPPKNNRRRLTSDAIEAWLLFRCVIHNPTVMARTAVLKQYAYDPAFPIAEDYDVWSRMLGHHRFAMLAEELTSYREHEEQVSTAEADRSLYFRQRVQARQLAALGMDFDERDLCYHSLLYTGRAMFRHATGRPMDMGYADWAGAWLEGLLRGNAEHRLYAQDALHDLCARLWWSVCVKAGAGKRRAVWRAFVSSPLARRAPAALAKERWATLLGAEKR